MIQIGPTRYGIDLRRRPAAGLPGTFRNLKNCVVNNGGEIEKRKAFVDVGNLAGTVGMATFYGQLHVFGSGVRPTTLDKSIGYIRLQNNDETLTKIVASAEFGGKVYAIGRFSSGKDVHFYNGVPVEYWNDGGFEIESISGVADFIARSIDSHPDFTAISFSNQIDVSSNEEFTFNATVSNNPDSDAVISSVVLQEYESGVQASGAIATIQFGAIAGTVLERLGIGNLDIIENPIISTASGSENAQKVKTEIEKYASWLTVSRSGATLTITAPIGSDFEGKTLNWEGTMPIVASLSFIGGNDAQPSKSKIVRFTIGGEYKEDAVYQIVLNAQAFAKGEFSRAQCDYIRPFGRRLWSVFGERISFSALDDATVWVPADDGDLEAPIGAGFLRVDTQTSTAQKVKALVPYAEALTAICQGTIGFINVDPDPDNIGIPELIETTGTRFPLSCRQQGSRDILYMSSSGIRSIKSRVSYDAPFIDDVGSFIDKLVSPVLKEIGRNSEDSVVNAPDEEGRSIFFVRDKAYVLSFFPNEEIQAWSEWQLPGVVSHVAWTSQSERLWIRCGNRCYLYGGISGDVYDNSEVLIETSYVLLSPVDDKPLEMIYVDIENKWDIDFLYDPRRTDIFDRAGTYDENSGNDGKLSIRTKAKTMSIRLKCRENGKALVSSVAII